MSTPTAPAKKTGCGRAMRSVAAYQFILVPFGFIASLFLAAELFDWYVPAGMVGLATVWVLRDLSRPKVPVKSDEEIKAETIKAETALNALLSLEEQEKSQKMSKAERKAAAQQAAFVSTYGAKGGSQPAAQGAGGKKNKGGAAAAGEDDVDISVFAKGKNKAAASKFAPAPATPATPTKSAEPRIVAPVAVRLTAASSSSEGDAGRGSRAGDDPVSSGSGNASPTSGDGAVNRRDRRAGKTTEGGWETVAY
jgi:hypothetical protein